MHTKGLILGERDIENISKLVEALKSLPENTIEGFSEYDPGSFFLKAIK